MARMDMHARREYLNVVRERYLQAETRAEKSRILDQYCGDTGQSRKYVIRRIGTADHHPGHRKKRTETYDGLVIAALARMWQIFDYPCGQRLKPLLEEETGRLRELGELNVSDEVADKLMRMSPATIDRKLRHEKEVLRLRRPKGSPGPGSLLRLKVPVRLNDWETSQVGYVQPDLVEHCGSTTAGEYVHSVSTMEVCSGWWEGEAIMSKCQEHSFQALRDVRERCPFDWKGVHPDNGSEFINQLVYKYCRREGLEFSRSRPYRKNDNAYIEQKNWTHVRKVLGYLRYDTPTELRLINDLYHGPLRLYKNFFQPVMKLTQKVRVGGRVTRRYDRPASPYRRLIESGQITEETVAQLEAMHAGLNPAQLKREVDASLDAILNAYERKNNNGHSNPHKRQTARSVTSFMRQQPTVGLPS
jgi:hypothetical protein